MDNPNDFIHIDEVFKRLKDAEEPIESGSWMRMKDLLDSEMPIGVSVAARSGFHKYVLPIVAALLVGSSLAYFNIRKSDKLTSSGNIGNISDRAVNNNGANVKNADPGAVSSLASSDRRYTENKPDITEGAISDLAAENTPNGNLHRRSNANDLAFGDGKTTGKIEGHSSPAHHAASTDVTIRDKKNSSGSRPDAGTIALTGNTEKGAVQSPSKSVDNKHLSETAKGGKSVAATERKKLKGAAIVGNSNVQSKATAFERQNLVEQIYPSSTPAVASANNNDVPILKTVASNFNNEKIVKDEHGSLYKEERDTIKRIDMISKTVSKNKNGSAPFITEIDTLSVTRVERIKFTPLNKIEMASLRAAHIIPMAEPVPNPFAAAPKSYTVTTEAVNLVPLSNYKVATRKVDPSKFNQLVHSTSQGLSNYFDGTRKFYAAVFLGGNGLMGNPTGFGMQLGIAGIYQLNERLTLMSELKYANHYFSNYSINDQSVTYENINSLQVGGEWLFTGTRNVSMTTYNVSSFSALEFPVSLSYSLGTRVSILAGVNLAYAFPSKWNKQNVNTSEAASSTQNQNENPFINTPFVLNESSDFGGRFGMGYVAGLTYDISRKLSFDARVSQNLWTSYNGDANAVNKLYKMPSLQLSLGFFFGRKDKVTYIMDRR